MHESGLGEKYRDRIALSVDRHTQKVSNRKVVLWLRGFCDCETPWFGMLLQQACRDLGTPLTLTDLNWGSPNETMRSPVIEVQHRECVANFKKKFWLFGGIVFLGICVIGCLHHFTSENQPADRSTVSGFVFVLWFFSIIWAIIVAVVTPIWMMITAGRPSFEIQGNDWKKKLQRKLLRELFDAKLPLRNGLLTIRCGIDDWKGVIEFCIRVCRLVIVDVSYLSEPMIWEISTSLDHLTPESIILCLREDMLYQWPEVDRILSANFGVDKARRFVKFTYPNALRISNGRGIALDVRYDSEYYGSSEETLRSMIRSNIDTKPSYLCNRCGAVMTEDSASCVSC